jgi:hypothetical protein
MRKEEEPRFRLKVATKQVFMFPTGNKLAINRKSII